MSDNKLAEPDYNAESLTLGIVAARFNEDHVNTLLDRTVAELRRLGVQKDRLLVKRVPGSNEIPYLCNMLALTHEFDCLIALGVVIAGSTSHHELIAQCTAQSLQNIGLHECIPVINGIITVENEDQARDRVGPPLDRGIDFARAAIEMAVHKQAMHAVIEELDDGCYEDPDEAESGGFKLN